MASETPAATPAAAGNVIDTLRADGHFTTLLVALDKAQLTETLRTRSAISIFAPTDAAFAAMSEADRTRLMDPVNVNALRQLLLYHVVVADVSSSQIEGTKGGVETAAGTKVELDGTGSAIKVDSATVTTADIHASNGAIFAIDQVLSPAAARDGEADDATAPVAAPAPAAPAAAEPSADTMAPDAPAAAPAPAEPSADTMAPDAKAPESMAPASAPPPVTAAPAASDDAVGTTTPPKPQ